MNFLSKFFIKFLSVIALLLVFGCGQKPAKIVNRSKVLYNKTNQFNLDKYQNYSKKTSKKLSQKTNDDKNKEEKNEENKISSNKDSDDLSSNHKSKKNLSKNIETNSHNSQEDLTKNPKDQQNLKNSKEFIAKEIIIENSDLTIYDIAKKHQISIREILDHNNLKAPYKLKKGDHLFIPKAQFHIVKKGETLFSISRLYNMKIDEIISTNSLIKPYGIKVGNKLQIANLSNNNPLDKNKSQNSKNSLEKNIDNKNSSSKNIAQNAVNNSPKNLTENSHQNPSDNSSENSDKNNSQELASNAKSQSPSNSNSSNQDLTNSNSSPQESTDNNSANNDQLDDKKNIFSWPVRGAVISKFGPKKGGLYNDGINIKAREGASVGSAEDGVVAYVGNELKGYGNLVIIKHSQGWITAYAHLKEFNVKRGQKILKSQKIGLVGSTGSVSFPQLYFGLRKGREALNPQNYLKSMN
jgi:murein DD-endopeptidase MepM/ murein hydrolase activator NlpD